MAWLRHTAKIDGAVYSQVLLHILDQLEPAKGQTQINAELEGKLDLTLISDFDPRLIALAASSEQTPPGPYSEDDLRRQWNAQADDHNQWESLDLAEQLAWAQVRAIAADRERRPTTPLAPRSAMGVQEYLDSITACSQPAPPAGGLVERVARALADTPDEWLMWQEDARDAIRAVAAAAKGRIAPFDPSLKWGDFAQWLEQEADRG